MLRIEHVSKDMGEFLLKDVSLQVSQGEYVVIIGPTGAGKTILVETVAGIYPPDAGRVLLNGRDITHEEPRNRNISMVYQDYMLFPHLSVHDNIAFGLRNRQLEKPEIERRVEESADLLGISHLLHRRPDTLSGGEQQRAAIARAIVMEPSVLLLDEPLSALDGRTREALRKELRRLHDTMDITVLHITHNFEEVFSLADRVAVMNRGEIVQDGAPDEVFRKPNCEFIADFVGVENLFKGMCRLDNGNAIIETGDLSLVSTTCTREGEVFVSVRPEDIMVSRTKPEISAQNVFAGTVTESVNNGIVMRAVVDAGIPFVVTLTRQAYQDLDIKKGDSIYLLFKAASVHVF
ncbi:MAG: tungstate ABC transporter ATP-binding protein WtpC [Methanomicrobiaceae archaeon]|nr:tungstate ABC transporter ATP-binding protein WtpC [Methanomicrobiaceae archaeon]